MHEGKKMHSIHFPGRLVIATWVFTEDRPKMRRECSTGAWWGWMQTKIAQGVNLTGLAWPLLFSSPAFEMQCSMEDEVTLFYAERFQNGGGVYSYRLDKYHLEKDSPSSSYPDDEVPLTCFSSTPTRWPAFHESSKASVIPHKKKFGDFFFSGNSRTSSSGTEFVCLQYSSDHLCKNHQCTWHSSRIHTPLYLQDLQGLLSPACNVLFNLMTAEAASSFFVNTFPVLHRLSNVSSSWMPTALFICLFSITILFKFNNLFMCLNNISIY